MNEIQDQIEPLYYFFDVVIQFIEHFVMAGEGGSIFVYECDGLAVTSLEALLSTECRSPIDYTFGI